MDASNILVVSVLQSAGAVELIEWHRREFASAPGASSICIDLADHRDTDQSTPCKEFLR